MSQSVNRSESTASQYGFVGPTTAAIVGFPTPAGTPISGQNPAPWNGVSGTLQFTGFLSGITYTTIGAGVSGTTTTGGPIISGALANPAGFVTAVASNYISGGRIIIPFWYQVSGVP